MGGGGGCADIGPSAPKRSGVLTGGARMCVNPLGTDCCGRGICGTRGRGKTGDDGAGRGVRFPGGAWTLAYALRD